MRIALVGNQNCGKTSLFNSLTGSNQKIGNWAGVTIERKEGIIKGTNHNLIDLPGIYSLSPYTKEEEISRQFILNEKVDLIINLIDATSLERSLYLTTQILELGIDTIVVLNMEDLLHKKGLIIDENKLSTEFGITVKKISALKDIGIEDLISTIDNKKYCKYQEKPIYNNKTEKIIDELRNNFLSSLSNQRFVAIKIMENDPYFCDLRDKCKCLARLMDLEKELGVDLEEFIATSRYEYIEKIVPSIVKKNTFKASVSDKLDKIFLNKYFAIPIFIIIMTSVYLLSVGAVGSLTVDWVSELVTSCKGFVESWLSQIGTSSWLISLICDGIISGVGAMLNFVPQLIILFICISILETTGYMSRISFLLDKIFKHFGLSGKSLIPFIIGSGCSVPGIMASRTIENDSEKKMTIMLTPFIPCSAKLPIIIVFSSYFFKSYTGIIAASLYFLAIGIILLSSIVLKKYVYKSNSASFLLELSEYKAPSIKYIIRDVCDKITSFIKRAGTVILLASIILWFMLSFTWDLKYTSDQNLILDGVRLDELSESVGFSEYDQVVFIEDNGTYKAKFIKEDEMSAYVDIIQRSELDLSSFVQDMRKEVTLFENNGNIYYTYAYGIDSSILASIGKFISFLFYPMLGELNWAASVCAIQGLVAKEQVVSSMAIISGFNSDIESGALIFSNNGPFASISALSAYAFMAFNLFSAPCLGALGAMKRELGTRKQMLKVALFQTIIAFMISYLIFGIGSLLKVII